jgi:predicted membrane-bound spermidine synthase
MNPRVLAVSSLLFGSGLCALVYQTVWLREFRLIFGASTAATAAVLGIFMGGLGAGSMILGGRAEKAKRPLAFYANLELLIALSAAATPFLVTLVRHLYSALGGSLALGPTLGAVARLALSAVVLAVPTLLMGGTLPAAARSVTGREDAARRSLALLYGINTLGAVTGAVLSTFVALEALGNRDTLWVACLLNALVAVAARMLSRTFPAPDDEPSPVTPEQKQAAAPPAFVLTAAAVVGFAFLLMELVWYRMLSPLLGGSTFTFGLILAVALLGIGIGGALYAFAAQKSGGTLSAFAWTCALEALAIAIPFALGDRLAVLAAHLRSLSSAGFPAHIFGWFIIIAIVILPAAIVAGFQFPLLVALLGRGGHGVARQTARAYTLNTAGAIAGSLAGGFGLMPLFTAPGLWRLVTVLLVGLSIAALAVRHRRAIFRSPSGLGALGTAGAAASLLLCLGPTAAWRHSGVGVGRSELATASRNALIDRVLRHRMQLVWEADGIESSVGISASNGASFVVNGKSDGNIRADAGTQVLGGLIGAALKPDVRTACVIGLGTGSTAGWLAAVPEIERVDVMELEPAILHMARVCEMANLQVLDNPKCHILLGDAREMLITGRRRYDLIFSEPSNPYRAGIASLFTTEFYRTARERLNQGGLFLQWVQAYEVEGDAVRMILATLSDVFPHVEVWTTQAGDLLLVAAPEPRQWDAGSLRARIQIEPFKTATQRIWGVDSAEGFLAHFAAGPELARRIAALPDVGRNTDDNTKLEFAFARSVGKKDGFRMAELLRAAQELGASRPALTGQVDWARVEEEQLAMLAYEKADVSARPTAAKEVATRCEIRRLVETDRAAEAGRLWLTNRPAPINPRDVLSFAEALADAGSEEALPFIEKMRAAQPGEAATLEALLRIRQGRPDDAASALLAALAAFRSDAWPLGRVQLRAFDLAVQVVIARPENTTRFFETLKSGPFPGYLMESARLQMLVRLELRRWQNGEGTTNIGYALIEPWSYWSADYLKGRYTFYKRTGLGDAARARKELEEFLSADSSPFDRELEPSPARSVALPDTTAAR